MVASSIITGMIIGAALGGKIMQSGRRRTLLFCCFMATVCISLTLIQDIRFLIIGRFLTGVAFTLTTFPKTSLFPALVAGFMRVLILQTPGMVNTPVLFISCVAISARLFRIYPTKNKNQNESNEFMVLSPRIALGVL